MLRHIKYSVTFSNGRTLENEIDFYAGLGAITGPNESGKTLVIEMVRYALFGTAALRGRSSSYSNINVELTFEVKGETYDVVRSSKSTSLVDHRSGSVICVGTTETNRKISASILGYDLSTFDTANVALQGDVERLSNMKPTDRKRMVDKLVGLESIDELTKYASEQALVFGREAAALSAHLREPEAPVQPQAYRPSSELKEECVTLEAKQQRLDRLIGELSVKREEPKKPECNIPLSSEELKGMADAQSAERNELRKLLGAPPPSPYSNEQLKEFAENCNKIEAAQEYERLSRTTNTTGRHTCPECSHTWYDDPDSVAALEQRMVNILGEAGISAGIDIEGYRLELQARTPLRKNEIIQHIYQNAGASDPARIAELETKLHNVPDFEKMYRERLSYETRLENYDHDLRNYQQWNINRLQLAQQVELLRSETQSLPELRRLAQESSMYERDRVLYESSFLHYKEGVERTVYLKEKQEGWQAAKKSLILLKTLVKSHLLPSLNSCASTLMLQMTGGQRQNIVVDDNFEVLVDGQDLETLSGSGKSVANLALRLGLGQVLTNGVFSVFIGDEIDAFMDADRAENTSQTLKNICNSILQVLVISHKTIEADYHIKLGNHA